MCRLFEIRLLPPVATMLNLLSLASFQAYLGYMASFVTMWGGEEETSKTGTHETSSSTDSADDTDALADAPGPDAHDEESPSVSQTPACDLPQSWVDVDNFFPNDDLFSADGDGFFNDEELMPLSPVSAGPSIRSPDPDISDWAGTDASQTKRFADWGNQRKELPPCDDEGFPLSPGSTGWPTNADAENPNRPRTDTPQSKLDFGNGQKGFVPARIIMSSSGGVELEESSSQSSRRRRQPLGRGEDSFLRCGLPAEKNRPSLSSQTNPSTTGLERSFDETGESDERKPLSPETPSLRMGGSWGRRSPSFLSSKLPQTPSMTSRKDGQRDGVNYFDSIISPLRSSPFPSVKRE